MTTKAPSLPLPQQQTFSAQHATAVTSPLLPTLLFLVGVKLPSYCADQAQISGMLDRITLVDIFTLIVCSLLAMEGKLRLSTPIVFYLGALFVAFVFGIFFCPIDERSKLFSGFFALLMAMLYYVVSYNVVTKSSLVKPLLFGLLFGVTWQSVIVLHDYFSAAQWFPDRMEHRVRGTFRVSGQLAAYGFSMAAVCLTTATIVRQTRLRHLLLLAGAMGIFMVVAATRRSGMLAIGGGIVVYLMLSCRQWYSVKRFLLPLLLCVILCIVGYRQADSLTDSFVGSRITASVSSLTEGGSWTESEMIVAGDTFGSWFPFGVGTGCGHLLTETNHEFHNGHLSLLIELGVFGLLAFYLCLLYPLFFAWTSGSRSGEAFRILLVTVTITAAAFMLHNRLHRDRGFMLYLGLTSGVTVTMAAGSRRSKP
ncbi:MAG TPA: hypothetical protein VMX74_07275 [Pirellulales bacterium]|nr:hypothetical protein [Pirellulales bacterium]